MVVVCWLAFVSTSFFEFAALLRVIACYNIIKLHLTFYTYVHSTHVNSPVGVDIFDIGISPPHDDSVEIFFLCLRTTDDG